MSFTWPILSIDLRWPLGMVVLIFLIWWPVESMRLRKFCRSESAQKYYVVKFRTWYILTQIYLHPILRITSLFARGKVPNWIVRLGVKKPPEVKP